MKHLLLLFFLALAPASATPLFRPIVGENLNYVSRPGETLLSIAFANGVAIEHLAFANGYPTSATSILPATRLVILNVPERVLYFFQDGELRDFLPVSVGSAPKTLTPLGSFSIIEKVKEPTWYAPAWAEQPGPHPPGPDNPLGDRWIGLSAPRVGIHGTNDPLNVGASVTHGCIRCYPEHIRMLYEKVRVGLPVRIERVEDVGRHRIVRATLAGTPISIVMPEGPPIGADMTRVVFDPAHVNVYRDDWRLEGEAA